MVSLSTKPENTLSNSIVAVLLFHHSLILWSYCQFKPFSNPIPTNLFSDVGSLLAHAFGTAHPVKLIGQIIWWLCAAKVSSNQDTMHLETRRAILSGVVVTTADR